MGVDTDIIMMWIAVGTFTVLVIKGGFSQARTMLIDPIIIKLNSITDQFDTKLCHAIDQFNSKAVSLDDTMKSLQRTLELVRDTQTRLSERIAVNEQATKALHKRVDSMEKKLEDVNGKITEVYTK